jgi:hypothetical protein
VQHKELVPQLQHFFINKVGTYDTHIIQAQKLVRQVGSYAKTGLLDVCHYEQWQ